MKLLAVILNYKTPDMTQKALASLLGELRWFPDARVTVVDNDSQDGSFEKLEAAVAENGWADRVRVIASDYNGGFAYGNNLAIIDSSERGEAPDHVYLLNSDAFPDPGCVKNLVSFLDAHPQAGIAGSYVHGPEPVPHRSAFRFHSLASEFEGEIKLGAISKLLARWIVAPPLPTETCRVDWLAGASMLVRRDVLEQVGLLDDAYFLYFEETDLCLRAQRAGFSTWYVVESSVTHIGSVSTGIKDMSRPTPAFWFASRRRFWLKNHGRAQLWAANLLYVVGACLHRARFFLEGRPVDAPSRHLRDFLRFNFRFAPVRESEYRPVPVATDSSQNVDPRGALG
jgi:N-acetylglucosaminyl-diphospho-decaprenol L-rhamnosyltransferase